MDNIIPSRNLNIEFIIVDLIMMMGFIVILLIKKQKVTLIFALTGGVIYFIVDYFFFYLLSNSRKVFINGIEANQLNYFLYLLWHELSSGISNFGFIFIALSCKKDWKTYLFYIILWWFVPASFSMINPNKNISCYRTTSSYHYLMTIILLVGYLGIICYNLFNKRNDKINILYLLIIGISVQFLWEFFYLLFNIRPYNDSSIQTLIIDSLLETNLGMPYLYFICRFINNHLNEDLSKKELNNYGN